MADPSLPGVAGETLHMWTQIVGKVKLELAPFLNELWQTGFHLTARGMISGLIPTGDRVFEVTFDFVDHNLFVATSDAQVKAMPLVPRSVADFYGEFMSVLRLLGVDVTINTRPVETPITIACDQNDTHASYDAEYVHRFWRILVQTERVLQRYRSFFSGKSSPILFYWGSFDLNETSYSEKQASPSGAPRFFQIAEDEENVACGFWPGNPNAAGIASEEPAFYSYASPAPEGLQDASVQPGEAYYDSRLGEFILRYEDARRAASPEQAILDFFQSTYEAGATLAGWDRSVLERTPAKVGHHRRVQPTPSSRAGP